MLYCSQFLKGTEAAPGRTVEFSGNAAFNAVVLKIIKSMKELEFSKLMAVYVQSNLESGKLLAPHETRERQLMLAEQEFYNYLSQVFFRTDGASYLIFQERETYVSALRLEPYQDGLLLTALETAPESRQMGFSKKLVAEVLTAYSGRKIYSHVDRRNLPSRMTHESCGFRKILDHAVYADGSVLRSSVTYCYE